MALVERFWSDWDMQCPPTYYGGFKEARVISFGQAERRLSNPRDGQWTGSTIGLRISDYDQSLRQDLAGFTDRYWTREAWTVRMISREGRANLETALPVFVGPVIEAQPVPPLAMDVTLGDSVSRGLLSDRHQIPWRQIGDGPLDVFDALVEGLDREAPEPIIYGEHRRILGDDPASGHGFRFTPILIGQRTVSAVQYWVWLVCGHAVADIPTAHVRDADGTMTDITGAEGTEWLIPHYAGYLAEFGAHYEDLTSQTFLNTRRYSYIYGKVGETNPDAAAAGELTLLISVDGIEPVGDGTGNCITDRLEQYEHFLVNFVAHSGANSYQFGDWLTNPTWAIYGQDVPIIDEESIATCQAIADYRLTGSPSGYIGAAVIGGISSDRRGVRDWIAAWNLSCDTRIGVTKYGQLRLVMLSPTQALKDAAIELTDAYEILEGGFGTNIGWDVQATQIQFRADFYHITGGWELLDSIVWVDAEANYGRKIIGEIREYRFAPGVTHATHLARLELIRTQEPPKHVTITTAFRDDLAALDLGDYLNYQHFAAVHDPYGSPLITSRLAQIEAIIIDVDQRTLRFECVDCEDLIAYDADVAA